MWRLVLAIILAPLFWAILQFPGNTLLLNFFPQAADVSAAPLGYLLLALLFAFGYAIFSGYCAAWVAATDPLRVGLGAGAMLLAVGIAVQVSYWDVMPVWWHLLFLASIVPFTLLGARFKGGPGGSTAAA